MKRWRFALSRRWFGYLAFVVVFAIACVALAHWQLARRDEARTAMERVENNWDRAPVAVSDVVASGGAFDPDDTWTPIILVGEYVADDEILARGRPLDGRAGFEQLVPFRSTDGRLLLVDRGWIPSGSEQDSPDAVPPVPAGRLQVVARVKPGEPTIAGRSAPEGQVATINLPAIATMLDQPLYLGAYGLLDSEDPAAADTPTRAVKPRLDEGPHLSYAFQWLVFGIMAFIGLAWAIRQEYRILNADDPREQERAARRQKKVQSKAPTDDEIEDSILEQAR